MLGDIRNATDSIHIMMFIFVPGYWGDQFADALIAQKQRGLEVRITTDRYGSKITSTGEDFLARMADAGIEIVVNDIFPLQASGPLPDRDRTWSQDEIGQADHRKMLVIDGRIGWLGGGGIQDHFASVGGETFRDEFVRVQGDVVRQMQAVFLTSFRAYGGDLPTGDDALAAYFPAPNDPGTISVTLLQNIPGGYVPATQASREAIENATTTLDIMNPYFTDHGMLDRIVAAAKRGVKARLVVSAESNNVPADAALQYQYDRLLAAGVEIWEYPGTMHAKVTVADDVAIVGTLNYDAWAMYRNLEMVLLIEDATIAQQIRTQYVDVDIARSGPPDLADGWEERVKAWIWDKLTYFI